MPPEIHGWLLFIPCRGEKRCWCHLISHGNGFVIFLSSLRAIAHRAHFTATGNWLFMSRFFMLTASYSPGKAWGTLLWARFLPLFYYHLLFHLLLWKIRPLTIQVPDTFLSPINPQDSSAPTLWPYALFCFFFASCELPAVFLQPWCWACPPLVSVPYIGFQGPALFLHYGL